MIDGPVPLAIFDKPQPGTGASLLAEVVSMIATGRTAPMMTAQKDDEGWRKAITSLLIKGQLVVTIDNVEADLTSPSLAAVLTAISYQDRVLGRSEILTLPNKTTWIATGNNIRLRGDLPRRCIWVRLDAKAARPWQRDINNFKHPYLIPWAAQEHGRRTS
jgi:putative DNA primase/helicase